MLVLGISGSPRRGGNTEIIIKEVLNAAEKKGAEIELISLSDYNLQPCNACQTCFKTKKCIIQDDYEELYQKIGQADGVILGSPSYFQGVTAQMKAFMDRIGYLNGARGRKDFVWKVGAAISVARRSGLVLTWNQMIIFLTGQRMIIAGDYPRTIALGREKGDVSKDEEGMNSARSLGQVMVKTIVATENLRKKL